MKARDEKMTAEERVKIIARHEMQAQGTNVTEATKGTKGTEGTKGTGRSLKSLPSLASLSPKGGSNG